MTDRNVKHSGCGYVYIPSFNQEEDDPQTYVCGCDECMIDDNGNYDERREEMNFQIKSIQVGLKRHLMNELKSN